MPTRRATIYRPRITRRRQQVPVVQRPVTAAARSVRQSSSPSVQSSLSSVQSSLPSAQTPAAAVASLAAASVPSPRNMSTNSSLSAVKKLPGKVYSIAAIAIWKSKYFKGFNTGVIALNDGRDKGKVFLIGNMPGIFSKSYLQNVIDNKWKVGDKVRVDYDVRYKTGDRVKLTNFTPHMKKETPKWYKFEPEEDSIWVKRISMTKL